MSYAEALERLKKLPPLPEGELTKPTKGAFVSYGSTRVGDSEKNTLRKSARKPAPVDTNLSVPVLALVCCGQCRHFEPNPHNPAQGLVYPAVNPVKYKAYSSLVTNHACGPEDRPGSGRT